MWGYKEIYDPLHPRAKKNGCVLEHIVVAEKKLGRRLKKGEVVHHRNEDRGDNRQSNLIVFRTQNDHAAFHGGCATKRHKDGAYSADRKIRKCVDCQKRLSHAGERCKKCFCLKNRESCAAPSDSDLSRLVWEMPTTQVAKMFGVSDSAVGKWCKRASIDKPPRGYWQKKNVKK